MFKEIEELNERIVERERELSELSCAIGRYEEVLGFEFRNLFKTRNQKLMDKFLSLRVSGEPIFVSYKGVANLAYIIENDLGPNMFKYIIEQFNHPLNDNILNAALKSKNPGYADMLFSKKPDYRPTVQLIKHLITENRAEDITKLHGLLRSSVFSLIEHNSGTNYTQRLFYSVYDNIIAPITRVFTKKPKENIGLSFLHYAKAVGANDATIDALKSAGVPDIRDRKGRNYEAYGNAQTGIARNIFERPSWVKLIKNTFGGLSYIATKIHSYCTVAGRQRQLDDIEVSIRRMNEVKSKALRAIPDLFNFHLSEGNLENLQHMLCDEEVLKEAGVNPELVISQAISDSKIDILKLLVEKFEANDAHLTLAIGKRSVEMVQALVNGARFQSESIDQNLDTAFMLGEAYYKPILEKKLWPSRAFIIHQLRSENLAQLQELKAHGYDFTSLDKSFSYALTGKATSFLHEVMSMPEPSMAMVKFLLDCGVDQNIKNAEGKTAVELRADGEAFMAQAKEVTPGDPRSFRREGREYFSMQQQPPVTVLAVNLANQVPVGAVAARLVRQSAAQQAQGRVIG